MIKVGRFCNLTITTVCKCMDIIIEYHPFAIVCKQGNVVNLFCAYLMFMTLIHMFRPH